MGIGTASSKGRAVLSALEEGEPWGSRQGSEQRFTEMLGVYPVVPELKPLSQLSRARAGLDRCFENPLDKGDGSICCAKGSQQVVSVLEHKASERA